MTQKVTGYITNDGKFFPDEREAAEYEAHVDLVRVLQEVGARNVPAIIQLINGCRNEIERYLAVHPVAVAAETEKGDTYEVDTSGFGEGAADGEGSDDDHISEENDEDAEDDTATVLPLPPGVREPMPDVGRHIQSTKVRVQRPVNVTRGGGGNASGVRRR